MEIEIEIEENLLSLHTTRYLYLYPLHSTLYPLSLSLHSISISTLYLNVTRWG